MEINTKPVQHTETFENGGTIERIFKRDPKDHNRLLAAPTYKVKRTPNAVPMYFVKRAMARAFARHGCSQTDAHTTRCHFCGGKTTP